MTTVDVEIIWHTRCHNFFPLFLCPCRRPRDSVTYFGPPPESAPGPVTGAGCYNCGSWFVPTQGSCPTCSSGGIVQLPGLTPQAASWFASFRELALHPCNLYPLSLRFLYYIFESPSSLGNDCRLISICSILSPFFSLSFCCPFSSPTPFPP